MSVQRTLDGGKATAENRGGVNTGSAVILEKADPDTDVERVARWVVRAKKEGLIK